MTTNHPTRNETPTSATAASIADRTEAPASTPPIKPSTSESTSLPQGTFDKQKMEEEAKETSDMMQHALRLLSLMQAGTRRSAERTLAIRALQTSYSWLEWDLREITR